MAFSISKEGYAGIAAPSSNELDIEKATPSIENASPSLNLWAYGSFMIKDIPEVEDEKTRGSRRGAFNIIVLSLIASLLLVGAFALGSLVIVTAVM